MAHLYTLSIFEQYHAALCLFDHNAGTHTPCLIRCMLEYFVDLINVLQDPNYVDQLKVENAHSDHKVVEKYVGALASVELEESMAGELAGLRAEIDTKERGKEQARSQKIANARQEELPWLYSLLCGMTHPNLTSLMTRHTPTGDEVAYCRSPDLAVHRMLLSITIRLLSMTLSQLPRFTDCDSGCVAAFVARVDGQNLQLQQALQAVTSIA